MIPYHRLYRNEVPQEGDLVVVKIINVDDLGAKCELLEYGGIEGMLLATEYTRQRVKSLKKLIQPGNQEVLCVIHVDEKRKYIDLSKKQVTSSEIEVANNRFYRSSFVNSIMRYLSSEFVSDDIVSDVIVSDVHVSNDNPNPNNSNKLQSKSKLEIAKIIPGKNESINIEDLYQKMCWLMDDEYGESYNALEQSVNNHSLLDKYEIGPETKIILIRVLHGKFIQQPKTISMIVEVKCLGNDGIKAIKHALSNNDSNSPTIDINVSVVKCPQYMLSTRTTNITEATEQIRTRAENIKTIIESYPHGYFSIIKDIDIQ